MILRLFVCAAMAAARLIELAWSKRNIRTQGSAQEGNLSRRTFPLIVALHTFVIGATAIKGSRRPHGSLLLLLLLLQPLRLWALLSLGSRWNARGAVPEDFEVVTAGPYRHVRHPNYAVVAGELFALPAAYRLGRIALYASLVNAGLLAIRIRDEEALLLRNPAYRDHFGALPRFLPRIAGGGAVAPAD